MRYLEHLVQDVRFGLRSLAGAPGFTAIAVLSLALGIMATTAIYSVVYAVVLEPFPYRDVDRLMSVRVKSPEQRFGRTGYTTDQFLEIAARNTIFEGAIASTISDVLWTGDGEPRRLRGNYGTPNTFLVIGVPPLLGRYYTPADGAVDATPVAVLGYRCWQRMFGGDPAVLGRQLRLNGKVRTVVGVMPQRFMWRGADVYLPVVFQRGRAGEGVQFVHLLGGLKPGVTAAQAEADLKPVIQGGRSREPQAFPKQWRVDLLSFKETFPSSIREALWILFGAVGLLLLIACANVSNLLLSRAAARQREIAVRAALGAGRLRIVRQLLTENLLLALAGAAVGVALAFAGLKAIIAIVPPNTIPDESEIAINAPVLLFTLAITAATVLLSGLAPALHACTPDLVNALKDAARGAGGGVRQGRLRGALVILEVALSLILLVGASLMVRTLLALHSVDPGIRTDRLLTMRVPLPESRYPDPARRIAFFRELLDRVAALPGVSAAAVNTWMHPFGNISTRVQVVGAADAADTRAVIHQVNPDYIRAMGIPLVAGRMFDNSETAARRQLAVVNQTFARRRLAGRNPLGAVLRIPDIARLKIPDDSFQVIGVAKDVLNNGVTREIAPEIYFPYTVTGMPDELIMIPVEGTLIQQVLVNLLDNAVKHTPENTRVQVAVEKEAGSIVFSVRDNGPGIPAEELDAVFDRFYTSPHAGSGRRGFGLGLAICKSIIEAHGGKIMAYNDPQGGAVFRFTLPEKE
jgi:predicted permease